MKIRFNELEAKDLFVKADEENFYFLDKRSKIHLMEILFAWNSSTHNLNLTEYIFCLSPTEVCWDFKLCIFESSIFQYCESIFQKMKHLFIKKLYNIRRMSTLSIQNSSILHQILLFLFLFSLLLINLSEGSLQ